MICPVQFQVSRMRTVLPQFSNFFSIKKYRGCVDAARPPFITVLIQFYHSADLHFYSFNFSFYFGNKAVHLIWLTLNECQCITFTVHTDTHTHNYLLPHSPIYWFVCLCVCVQCSLVHTVQLCLYFHKSHLIALDDIIHTLTHANRIKLQFKLQFEIM